MASEKECFIIMPITTPEHVIESYRDGGEHFKHVLDCLFIPSVAKAGYTPIPPIAKGADLIHAVIVRNVETADMVLCDMSCLNPNVFFEFGIRTSLNKPVCVIKDDLTEKVPFDVGIINYLEYKSSIDPWELEAEIKKISDHIAASADKSKGENMLWKYFGLKTEAVPYQGEPGAETKLDYITMQIDSMRNRIDSLAHPGAQDRVDRSRASVREVLSYLRGRLPDDVAIKAIAEDNEGFLRVRYIGTLDQSIERKLARSVRIGFGHRIHFVKLVEEDLYDEESG